MKEEIMDLVDENDNVIGQSPRSEIREKRLLHRGVVIVITNKEGKLLMQKRSMSKKIFPGKWGFAAGGGVDKGESYESAANRELEEEIGINTQLTKIAPIRYKDETLNHIFMMFHAVHEGPFVMNEIEISELKFMTNKEIEDLIKNNLLCADDIPVFKKFIEHTK